MDASRTKDIIFYSSWGLLFVFSFFRYQLWHIFDNRYCSETNLLIIVRSALKPDNWLLLAVFIFTIVAAVRAYVWASSRWLWFGHYGGILAIGILFTFLFLISWNCG